MVFWGCLVLFVCCMMAGICIWEMFNQLALLAVWKFAKSAECGMSAILKVPILGMIVNKSRGKKDKKAVKKWREDHMAKEWKCASMLQCLPVMCVLVCCCPCRHVAVQCLLVQINNFLLDREVSSWTSLAAVSPSWTWPSLAQRNGGLGWCFSRESSRWAPSPWALSVKLARL